MMSKIKKGCFFKKKNKNSKNDDPILYKTLPMNAIQRIISFLSIRLIVLNNDCYSINRFDKEKPANQPLGRTILGGVGIPDMKALYARMGIKRHFGYKYERNTHGQLMKNICFLFPHIHYSVATNVDILCYLYSTPWRFIESLSIQYYKEIDTDPERQEVWKLLMERNHIRFALRGENLKSLVLNQSVPLNFNAIPIIHGTLQQLKSFICPYSNIYDNFKANLLHECPNLEHLDLSINPRCDDNAVAAGLLRQRNLKTLKISVTRMFPEFVQQLMANNRMLTHMDINVQLCPTKTVTELTGSQSTLKYLKLTVDGIIYPGSFEHLPFNTTLEVLDLSNNSHIERIDLGHISKNQSLKKLIMQDYSNDRGQSWLLDLLQGGMMRLTELDITHNTGLEEQLYKLMKERKLQFLEKMFADKQYHPILKEFRGILAGPTADSSSSDEESFR